jgi:hypothetical protein
MSSKTNPPDLLSKTMHEPVAAGRSGTFMPMHGRVASDHRPTSPVFISSPASSKWIANECRLPVVPRVTCRKTRTPSR